MGVSNFLSNLEIKAAFEVSFGVLFSVGPNGVTFLSMFSLGIDLITKGLTQLVTGVVWIFLL